MQPITANRAASAIHTVTVALNPIAPTSNPKPNCFQKPGQAGLDSSTYKPKTWEFRTTRGKSGWGPTRSQPQARSAEDKKINRWPPSRHTAGQERSFDPSLSEGGRDEAARYWSTLRGGRSRI